MLKALELYGFKSFADKTRFEFPPGITVVVGPNGSGKSNIVDAMKWVLGEQSAKGLRGKDMADVIFKGSGGPSGRKPLNSAEATLVLDNEDGRFEYDATEIHVTRRVYRSGEGEYLINGEPCRLKDIRNLFRGTGAGTDAYSLIEQGKVDRLLQASPKDRRAIFEEAAGVSRFKAKKIETQRRLARVDQNLLRLSDIVEEVENRLRAVRAQASKAVRYREHTERLQELRTFVGMTDWRRLSERLATLEDEQVDFQSTLKSWTDQVEQAEQNLLQLDERLNEIAEKAVHDDAALNEVRQSIAEQESKWQLHHTRGREVEEQVAPLRRQLIQQRFRLREIQSQLDQQDQRLIDAELAFRESADRVAQLENQLEVSTSDLAAARQQREVNASQLATTQQELNTLESRRELLRHELQQLETSLERLQSKIQSWSLDEVELSQQYQQLLGEQQRLQEEMEGRNTELAHARHQKDRATHRLEELNQKIAKLQSDYNGIQQRASVIEELEEKLEGLNSGVKQALRESQQDREGPFGGVVGLVADLIQVNVQHASIVDTALGEMAQHLVVEDDRLIEELARGDLSLEGRVGIIRLGHYRAAGVHRQDLSGVEGVIGRADQMVQTHPSYRDLATQLLGGTWLVKSLQDALRLRQERARDVRLITLDGQIVDVDGTLVLGPKGRGLGLVSRRSELRALKREIQELEEELDLLQAQVIDVREDLQQRTGQVEQLQNQQEELSRALSDQQLMCQSTQQKLTQVQRDLQEHQDQASQQQDRFETIEAELSESEESARQGQQQLTDLQLSLTEVNQRVDALEKSTETDTKALTQCKVEMAKREQQLSHEEGKAADSQRDWQERHQAVDDLSQQLQRLRTSFEQSKLGQLAATSVLATLALSLEQGTRATKTRELERNERQLERRASNKFVEELRGKQHKLEGELHKIELELSQLNLERSTLAERLSDDYGIDISTVEIELTEEEARERDDIEVEIESLRRKINTIGAVNLDALNELEELEARFGSLDAQYQDLVQSKEMLEKIIEKINLDSRKLFAETLEAIRVNFQSLYRRSFGGGKADLVIEEGVDILEAGIDIVATPPGKPEFSNSLLSGGEKALTAVSLLMAIFQHRPSPFCVLDEVDAPFDEANVGRFVEVLTGFLDSTKFIIVTHSKKTMTAADTLYGITMQESGISKQVSVRFEDVSEDGQISEEAVHRETVDDSSDGIDAA
jgi:chromosome segregation protein